MRRWLVLAVPALLAGCAPADDRPEIVIQRFFGECGAAYGASTDVANAETECGILTTLINRFEAENADIDVKVNVVAWPGYRQLAAEIAARDPPDLVTMLQSVISDYSGRGLIEPVESLLQSANINSGAFTPAALAGVEKGGRLYGMPWDTIGRLFHINTALMAEAGLMKDGKPVLPQSPEELLAHARQFRAATGKPYLIQAQVSAADFHVALLNTYLLAQNVAIFPDDRHIRLDTPEAHAIVTLQRQLNVARLTTLNQDFPAATAAFTQGAGGIFPVDAWVVPAANRSAAERAAMARFLAFLARYNGDWARTGQLPAFAAVVDTDASRTLPHRANIATVARTGRQLPGYVQRQSAVQGLIGEELEAAITGVKPVKQALADAERRVNRLCASMI